MYTMDQLIGASALRPPSPAALAVLRLIGSQSYDRSEISQLVRQDPKMAAEVLRAAVGGGRQAARSIDAAIARLGEQVVEKLALHSALSSMQLETLPGYGMVDYGFWHTSVATAHACEALARRRGLEPGMMYTAGLLLDIGKIPIAPTIAEDAWDGDTSGVAVERGASGFDHATLGAELLASWQIPEPIPTMVRFHHEPSAAPAPFRAEVGCAHLGSWSTQWLGEPTGHDALRYPLDERAMEQLGIDDHDLRQVALAVVRGLNTDSERAL